MLDEIVWRPTGDDLEDDCVAEWRGLMLRAERMDRHWVWWAVYGPDRETLADCWGSHERGESRCESMKQARQAAEKAARRAVETG